MALNELREMARATASVDKELREQVYPTLEECHRAMLEAHKSLAPAIAAMAVAAQHLAPTLEAIENVRRSLEASGMLDAVRSLQRHRMS